VPTFHRSNSDSDGHVLYLLQLVGQFRLAHNLRFCDSTTNLGP
jgi:hypothetical protein